MPLPITDDNFADMESIKVCILYVDCISSIFHAICDKVSVAQFLQRKSCTFMLEYSLL